MLYRVEASISCATLVELNVLMYDPTSGFPHTDAANISDTVLPPPDAPQKWTKNGSASSGSIKTDANEAARATFGAILWDFLTTFAISFHPSIVPLGLITHCSSSG